MPLTSCERRRDRREQRKRHVTCLVIGGGKNPGVDVVEEGGSYVIQVAGKCENAFSLPQIPELYLIVVPPAYEQGLRGMEVNAAYGACGRGAENIKPAIRFTGNCQRLKGRKKERPVRNFRHAHNGASKTRISMKKNRLRIPRLLVLVDASLLFEISFPPFLSTPPFPPSSAQMHFWYRDQSPQRYGL